MIRKVEIFINMLLMLLLVISNVQSSMPNVGNENVKNKTKSDVRSNIQAPTCDVDFIPLGEKCYLFDTTLLTWTGALAMCNSIGANLAHISNYDENRLITEYLLDYYQGYVDFWIGANDNAVEGQWVWTDDNSTVSWSNFPSVEPNGGNEENCLTLWEGYNWAWNDYDCIFPSAFICQQQ